MATLEELDPVPAYAQIATTVRDPKCPLPDYTKPSGSRYHFTYDDLGGPLTCDPDYDLELKHGGFRNRIHMPLPEREEAFLQMKRNTFYKFWRAIREPDPAFIRRAIETDGVMSPCALNSQGRSPLITAISFGDLDTVRQLVQLGADVNQFAAGDWERTQRTPLQVAAAKGSLPIVRYLVQECGADDALLAPDGELALRLAADSGHREIVAYLPTRRGGGWRRWKAHHSKAMRRARKAGRKIAKFFYILLLEAPYMILFHGPYKIGRLAWRHKVGIAGWCAMLVIRTPLYAIRAVKALPKVVATLVKWLWKFLKASPEKIRHLGAILGAWLGKAIKGLGSAVAEVFGRLFSVLHTVIAAMFRFIKDLTFRDVWNGFQALVRAVFVGLPKAVVKGILGLAEATYEAFKALLGVFGGVAFWILSILVHIIMFVPFQIVRAVRAFGKSVAKGLKEVMVWYDPKLS